MSSTRATGPNWGRRRQHSEDGDHELTVKSVVHMTPGSALARTRAEGPVAFNARGSTLVPSVEPGPPEHLGAPGSGHPPLAGRFVDSADCLFLFVEQWVLHHRTLATESLRRQSVHHRSRITSPRGREQQISASPCAGGSSGSGSYSTSPPISAVSQVWQTPVRQDHLTGTSHASASSSRL